MAVSDSTAMSVCLYCKTTSEAESEKEFHEIYDEVGLELQLPSLVEQFFDIKLQNKTGQCLCDDCVNRLIELYDLAEHIKQDENEPSALNAIEKGNLDVNDLSSNEENVISLNEVKQDFKLGVENEKESNQDIKERHKNYTRKISKATKKKEALTFQSTSNCMEVAIESIKPDDNCSNDPNISFIEEDIDYNSEVEQATKLTTIAGTEIPSGEFDIIEENPNDLINDQESEENTNTLNDHLQEEQDIYEEQVLIEDKSTKDSDNDVYTEEFVLEEQDEELEEEAQIQERFHSIHDNEQASGSKTYVECNENVLEIDVSNANSNTENENDGKNDQYCTEEEYLVEETNFIEEYDCVDLNEYFDKAITTKFKDLELNWEVECKLCFEKYNTFQDLLNHSCLIELIEEQQCCCIIEGCEENQNDLNSLARHLILQHYDKLEDIAIYGRCPDCQKTFSNIIDFNKHSCCRDIKRKVGYQKYCLSCEMDFQSLKRYIFHMQFHLTNHRPKICLLCGSLFNNSNKFFEHIQYEHKPLGAMACTKCDRFFKEKEVYESHMQLHEESKYQYICTYCPKKYTNKCGLNQHMDIYHNHKHKPLQCDYCDKEFFNNISYRNHMKTHVPDVQVESFICSICGLITKYLDVIKDHVDQDKDSPCFSANILKETLTLGYTCENCSLDFLTIKHLKQHRLSSNHSDKIFYCVICRREFTTLRHMRSHATNHKEFDEWQEAFPITRYFVCNVGQCEEFYPLWSSLYYHKQRRHKIVKDSETNNDFKCQFCQQLCTSKMSLAIHVARSHNNSNIRCTECGQTYKSQQHLQDHIDKIHVEVVCKICFKKFKNRRNLNIHNQSVHLNEKRYFCKYCNKGYFYKSEKDSHEKQVHPEVSYRCELCNFQTNYPKSLEIHLDKHNNQLKFKCTICTKSFGRKQLLVQHINRHQGKKNYKCQDYFGQIDCDAAFITYNQLENHIQNEHKNSSNEQKATKRKRISKSHRNVVQMEDDNIEFIEEEHVVDTPCSKRSKENSNKNNNDDRIDNDSFEIIVANEGADDNEYVIQYKDDINTFSE